MRKHPELSTPRLKLRRWREADREPFAALNADPLVMARSAWGKGFATEAARASLAFACEEAELAEIVSFTTATNARSRAVMERIGMTHNPDDDFDHPDLPEGDPLRRHVLYRIHCVADTVVSVRGRPGSP